MKIQAALITEQGVTFAVVVVKPHVLNSPQAPSAALGFARYFPGVPIVLMAQDAGSRPRYYGRRDIVRFLTRVPMEALPWKEYTFTQVA